MKPFLALSKLWPWLPHFRLVAEYESLGKAARRLGVTTAALSKSVKQLETALGYPLFDRTGGKLRLNSAGQQLHHQLRATMRDLDNAITTQAPQHRPIALAIDPSWAVTLHVPLQGLELRALPAAPRRALLRGEFDVAIVDDLHSTSDQQVVVRELLVGDAGWAAQNKAHLAHRVATPTVALGVAAVTRGAAAQLPLAVARAYAFNAFEATGRSRVVALSRATRPGGSRAVSDWVEALAMAVPSLALG